MSQAIAKAGSDRLRSEELLRKRAEKLARTKRSDAAGRHFQTVAVVAVGKELLGIPVANLGEIVPVPPITPLPRLPSWMLGIAHVRGELLSVASAAKWFGVETNAAQEKMAVLESSAGPLGLVVERVVEFREIHSEELAEDLGAAATDMSRPVLATTKDLIAILDVDRLLASESLIVSHASG